MNSYKILLCVLSLNLLYFSTIQARLDTTALFYLDGKSIDYQQGAWLYRLNKADFDGIHP